MQTASFIQASAEITTITKLKKGDVYKRLNDKDYGDDKITHGIVLDVLYNGTDAAIQCMEFESSYSSLKTEFKVFGGDKEIKIFPSNKEEVQVYLKDAVGMMEEKVTEKRQELAQAEVDVEKAKAIVSGSLVKKLTTPEFSDEPIKQLEEV
jgi:hypothetical protein